MLLMILGINQDIVDGDYHRPVQHRSAHEVHEIHECDRSISEPKQHHHELIVTIASPKGCLRYVVVLDSHLVITQLQINLEN